MTIQDQIFGMSSAAREVMRCLFFHGPTEDGDVPSKAGRGELVKLGYADRGHGLQWLTSKGIEFGVKSMLLDQAKEKWQRERSRASRPAVSADGIALILSENRTAGVPYLAVKIAEAVESGDYTRR